MYFLITGIEPVACMYHITLVYYLTKMFFFPLFYCFLQTSRTEQYDSLYVNDFRNTWMLSILHYALFPLWETVGR